jgi:methylated-DNA-[protein]-cysteine S-methyltransferase
MTRYTTFDSPVGTIVVAARDAGLSLVRIQTPDGRFGPERGWTRDDRALSDAVEQFREYFAGVRREFALALDLTGTAFQVRVWAALQRVPYGATTTYTELAEQVGSPRASRAVGLAMRTNPFSIILPCHRVLGRDGSLTGYLNGLDTKRQLLAFEAANLAAEQAISWESARPRLGPALYGVVPEIAFDAAKPCGPPASTHQYWK